MTKKLLVISPHPDDEVLGAGGTIAKYKAQGYHVTVLTIAGHLPPVYNEESYKTTLAEAKKSHHLLGVSESLFLDFPATTLVHVPVHEISRSIQQAVNDVNPDVVLIPYPDRHTDHKVVFELSLVATRPYRMGNKISLVAAYETISSTHWNAPHIEPNFSPTWVVNITEYIEKKISAYLCYKSQYTPFPGPRSEEAARSLATFRGSQSGFACGEAFHIIRMVG